MLLQELLRLGAASSFITVTGENETSEFVRNELIAEGVDLILFTNSSRKRGKWCICTSIGK